MNYIIIRKYTILDTYIHIYRTIICVDKSMQKFFKQNREVNCATPRFRPGGHLDNTMN